METAKSMEIKEFRDLGFLQELNRLFLHPCGLALEICINTEGNYTFGKIWDYRNDPEGLIYGPNMISNEKIKSVQKEMDKHTLHRINLLGKVIQEK